LLKRQFYEVGFKNVILKMYIISTVKTRLHKWRTNKSFAETHILQEQLLFRIQSHTHTLKGQFRPHPTQTKLRSREKIITT